MFQTDVESGFEAHVVDHQESDSAAMFELVGEDTTVTPPWWRLAANHQSAQLLHVGLRRLKKQDVENAGPGIGL